MPRKPTHEYKEPPTRPINQWVREALKFADMAQAELSRQLHARGIGGSDKSIANKMAHYRNVSAEEADAISEITRYPRMGTTEASAAKSLINEIIDLLPEADQNRLAQQALAAWRKNVSPSRGPTKPSPEDPQG